MLCNKILSYFDYISYTFCVFIISLKYVNTYNTLMFLIILHLSHGSISVIKFNITSHHVNNFHRLFMITSILTIY